MHKSEFGDRMKRYEQVTRTVLPRRTQSVIRCDGRAFHSYLRNAVKPFDFEFMDAMDNTAKALCQEVSGTKFAYVQSDEISLLVTDFSSVHTEPWFNGEVQKIVSIAASIATANFNALRPGPPPYPQFDARVFTIPDPVDTANYFIWRQRDAIRNSISMVAQSYFSHKQLHGVNINQMQEKLCAEHRVNWNDYPDNAKRGRVVLRKEGERPVTFTHKRTGETETNVTFRSWWEAEAAPHFSTENGCPLMDWIPMYGC